MDTSLLDLLIVCFALMLLLWMVPFVDFKRMRNPLVACARCGCKVRYRQAALKIHGMSADGDYWIEPFCTETCKNESEIDLRHL